MSEPPFPPKVTAPARRALEAAGIVTTDDLRDWSEPDVLALRGVGPRTVELLRPFLSAGVDPASPHEKASPIDHTDLDQVMAYLADLDAAPRATLDALRANLRSILPHADECLKYGMPAFALDGKGVAGYAAFADHCSYFPMSGMVLEEAGEALDGYDTSKGGLRFGFGEQIPIALVRLLVKLRLAELGSVRNGKRTEYYDDGLVKAHGTMKDGQMHGSWRWFRRDGSVMRTGQFSGGEQSGTWTTFDRKGRPLKVTEF